MIMQTPAAFALQDNFYGLTQPHGNTRQSVDHKSDQSEQHLEIFTLCTTLNLKHATQLP